MFVRLVRLVVCLGYTCNNYGILSGYGNKYDFPDGNPAAWRPEWRPGSSMASGMAMQLQLCHVSEFPSHASKAFDARDAMRRLFGFH